MLQSSLGCTTQEPSEETLTEATPHEPVRLTSDRRSQDQGPPLNMPESSKEEANLEPGPSRGMTLFVVTGASLGSAVPLGHLLLGPEAESSRG